MNNLPSMSKWERIMNCGAEVTLPEDVTPDEDVTHRERGKAVHLMLHKGADAAIAAYPEHADYVRKCAHAYVPNETREVAFAVDLETLEVRQLDVPEDSRDYGPLGKYEVAGRLDAVSLGHAVVCDDKTGTGHPRARESWQLTLHALCVIGKHDEVDVCFRYFDEDGKTHEDWHMWTRAELHARAARMLAKAKQLRSGDVPPKAGAHCTYCTAKNSCSAFNAPVDVVRTRIATIAFEDRFFTLLHDDPAEAYDVVKALEKLTERCKDRLKTRAVAEPFTLKDGKTYGQQRRVRLVLDEAALREGLPLPVLMRTAGFTIEALEKAGVTREQMLTNGWASEAPSNVVIAHKGAK